MDELQLFTDISTLLSSSWCIKIYKTCG